MQTRGTGGDENGKGSIFTMLEDNPRIGQAKVSFTYDTMKALTGCLCIQMVNSWLVLSLIG